MAEPKWLKLVWARAVTQAIWETGLGHFPDTCPWSLEDEVLREGWLPE